MKNGWFEKATTSTLPALPKTHGAVKPNYTLDTSLGAPKCYSSRIHLPIYQKDIVFIIRRGYIDSDSESWSFETCAPYLV